MNSRWNPISVSTSLSSNINFLANSLFPHRIHLWIQNPFLDAGKKMYFLPTSLLDRLWYLIPAMLQFVALTVTDNHTHRSFPLQMHPFNWCPAFALAGNANLALLLASELPPCSSSQIQEPQSTFTASLPGSPFGPAATHTPWPRERVPSVLHSANCLPFPGPKFL